MPKGNLEALEDMQDEKNLQKDLDRYMRLFRDIRHALAENIPAASPRFHAYEHNEIMNLTPEQVTQRVIGLIVKNTAFRNFVTTLNSVVE